MWNRNYKKNLFLISACTVLFFIAAHAKKAKEAEAKQEPVAVVQKTSAETIFEEITRIFVEAENWGLPYIPVHIAFLDLILALDTCAAYRKAMGKEKHPALQVR
jgi:hypothetical protein